MSDSKLLISLVALLVLLMCVVFCLAVMRPFNADPDPQDTPRAFCGVEAPDRSPVSGRGKYLFRTNCAQCHNRDMRSDLTGPGLGGSIQRWRHDTASYVRYLLWEKNDVSGFIPEYITDNHPIDPVSFDNMTSEDVKTIIAFIEMAN